MNDSDHMDIETRAALARLFDLASSDMGQARRAADMARIFAFLGQNGGAIYADASGYRERMEAILHRWRTTAS